MQCFSMQLFVHPSFLPSELLHESRNAQNFLMYDGNPEERTLQKNSYVTHKHARHTRNNLTYASGSFYEKLPHLRHNSARCADCKNDSLRSLEIMFLLITLSVFEDRPNLCVPLWSSAT
jgi:hypothetical protein